MFGELQADYEWDGNKLMLGKKKKGEIVPDENFPGMWRVKLPGKKMSGMLNKARAKELAVTIALKGVQDNAKATNSDD